MTTYAAPPGAPMSLERLRAVGPRANVVHIVPPRHVFRPAMMTLSEKGDNELITHPLSSPTGPGGAAGFSNRAGSQIAAPHVTNVYFGKFWGDLIFFEGFCKAIVEYGYLDPLHELGYGTGSGTYAGSVQGEVLAAGTVMNDADIQKKLADMLDSGALKGDANSLFMTILPTGVISRLDGDQSCTSYCGYHESFVHNGVEIAYGVMPSPAGCAGCGNGDIGDFTATYAHELAEASTDKVPGNGWVAADGQENGDLEAWIMFGWGPPSDPKRYTIQGYYTNERGNTIGSWRGPDA